MLYVNVQSKAHLGTFVSVYTNERFPNFTSSDMSVVMGSVRQKARILSNKLKQRKLLDFHWLLTLIDVCSCSL